MRKPWRKPVLTANAASCVLSRLAAARARLRTVPGTLVVNEDRVRDVRVAVANTFCPTGKGGGVDPTCSRGGKGRVLPAGDLRDTVNHLRDDLSVELDVPKHGTSVGFAVGELSHGGAGSSGDRVSVPSYTHRDYNSAAGKSPSEWTAEETDAVRTVHHEVIHTLGAKEYGFGPHEQHYATTGRDVPSSTDDRKMVKAGVGLFLEEAPVEVLTRHSTGELRGKPWNFKKDSGAYQQYVVGLESLAKHAGVQPHELAALLKKQTVRDRLVAVGKILGGKGDDEALHRGHLYTTEVLSHGNSHPVRKKDFADVIRDISSGRHGP